MFLSRHRKTFLRAGRLLNKNLPYYQFSQNRQNENEEEEDLQREKPEGSSFPILTTLLGSILAGGIGYALYQDFTKGSGSKTLDSKSETKLSQTATSPAVVNAIETYGKNSQEVASLLKEEAKTSYVFGKFEDSIALYNEAIRIYSTIKSPESEEVAQLNRDLGTSYLKIGKIDEARDAIKKSGDISFGLGQTEQGFEQLETLALTYFGDFAKGRELFEDIIKQRKEKIGKNDPMLAKTYIRLAMLYSTQKMQEDVLDNLKQAFSLMKSQKIPEDKLSNVYQELSLVYHNIHAYNEALNATQKAIDHLNSKKDAEKIALLTKQIAVIHSQLRNPAKSIETFKLYADRVKNFEGYKLDLGDTYRRIAEEYEKIKNYDEAIQYWNNFVEIYRTVNKPELGIAGKMKQCSLYLKANKQNQGIDCFEDVFMWASRDLGEQHKLTNDAFEILKAYKKG